jgi:catalase
VAYEPNSLESGAESRVDGGRQGFQSHADAIDSPKQRGAHASFDDHFSQASLFWASQSPAAKDRIVDAFQRELWRVEVPAIRQRVVDNLAHVDARLARRVAEPLGIAAPDSKAAAGRAGFRETRSKPQLETAASLAAERSGGNSIASRRIAVLVAAGVEVGALRVIQHALQEAGASSRLLADRVGTLATASGQQLAVEHTYRSESSVMFDAVIVPGGAASVDALAACCDATRFVQEAWRHGKAICVVGDGVRLLAPVGLADAQAAAQAPGIVVGRNDPPSRADLAREFIAAVAAHRHWSRFGAGAAS